MRICALKGRAELVDTGRHFGVDMGVELDELRIGRRPWRGAGGRCRVCLVQCSGLGRPARRGARRGTLLGGGLGRPARHGCESVCGCARRRSGCCGVERAPVVLGRRTSLGAHGRLAAKLALAGAKQLEQRAPLASARKCQAHLKLALPCAYICGPDAAGRLDVRAAAHHHIGRRRDKHDGRLARIRARDPHVHGDVV